MNHADMKNVRRAQGIPKTTTSRFWQFHALYFSLNLALASLLVLEFGYDGILVPMLRLEDIIYYRLGLKAGGGMASGYMAFFVCLAFTATCLFLLLRYFRWQPFVEY